MMRLFTSQPPLTSSVEKWSSIGEHRAGLGTHLGTVLTVFEPTTTSGVHRGSSDMHAAKPSTLPSFCKGRAGTPLGRVMIRGYETSGRSRYSRQRVHPLPSSARRSPQLTTARANRNAAARLGPARRTAMRQSTTPRLLARLRSSFRMTAPVIPTATSFPTTDEIRAAMLAHYDRRWVGVSEISLEVTFEVARDRAVRVVGGISNGDEVTSVCEGLIHSRVQPGRPLRVVAGVANQYRDVRLFVSDHATSDPRARDGWCCNCVLHIFGSHAV